ncbi:MAG TPA: ribosomal RNA small subunit methyltransferase A [Clostridiales bacterium]|nr:ribosomal RNA small subunit methyltransferase A [Clostridiales bacterium]
MGDLLSKFKYKKSLGQNFIFDTNLLESIVSDSEIDENDIVVEIGTGSGTLTKAIAKKAKKVFSFEIDKDLMPILQENLKGIENIEVIFKNILKTKKEDFLKIVPYDFKVVANIPYYITTPLIMYFVESNLPVKTLTLTIQEEVAKRLVAKPNTEDYGAITLSLNLESDVFIKRNISRFSFKPSPKVNSSVVHIVINREKYLMKDKAHLKKLIRAGFQMRRKTFANNITQNFANASKEDINNMLEELGYNKNVRGEALGIEDYILISNKMIEKGIN